MTVQGSPAVKIVQLQFLLSLQETTHAAYVKSVLLVFNIIIVLSFA